MTPLANRRNAMMALCALLAAILVPGRALAAYDYININNPFLRKIPLAVPVFKAQSGGQDELEAAVANADLLAETLDFTAYFKILDRASFLDDPSRPKIAETEISFANWTGVGADLLITGGVVLGVESVEFELRLFDTYKQKMLLGKRYRGNIGDQRQIIRRFCAEVIYLLTGQRGIFESRLAFVSNGTGNKEIYICEFDGHNPQPFTRNGAINLSPAWSSDGQWLAYTSYARGNPDLYIRNLSDKRGAVVSKKGLNITPAWVPGAFQLAATLSFEGDQEIYLLTGTGEIIKRLTRSGGSDVSPSFSPDGKRMAFVSSRSGSPQIYVQEVDSGSAARLTFEGTYNTQPAWSPRGDRIVYTARIGDRHQICLIGLDGRGAVQLTRSSGDNESPAWAPDGSLIVFSSTRGGSSAIYIMTAFGTDQRRLLDLPGEQSSPKWSPGAPER